MQNNLAYEGWRDPPREELIGGKIVAMAPAGTNHTTVAGNIFAIFRNYLKGKPCKPFSDGSMVYLTEDDHFVPDMMVVCDRSKIKGNGVYGAPDLVVEVLSPGTAKNDRQHKKDVYARCGVREYWIVDTANRSVEVYLPSEGQLILHDVYTVYRDWELEMMKEEERAAVKATFRCSLFDGLEIALDEVFDDLLE